MQEVTEQMRNFLQFIALQFITQPDQAQLRVAEASDDQKLIRFRLIVSQQDVAILIGKNGFTASAIRNVLKAAAIREGINATLQIVSHEEEHIRMAALENGEIIQEEHHEDDQSEADDEHLEDS
ncbi:MAG: KH domain-containing protein [Akkermansiaceae bacterium]